MKAFICQTCGTQFSPADAPPEHCPICEDPRQYVGHSGQEWTTLEQLRLTHKNVWREEEPGLSSLAIEPHFAIGQQAFLVQTSGGNLLWDCVALLDDETVERVESFGGIQAIAVSHPHFYTTVGEWSRRFGDAPIFLHERDRQWVMDPDSNIHFWGGETFDVFGGLRLVHTGGHFDGFQVAHWPDGAEGRGVLLAGDQPQVCEDYRWVSFMYSYPNYIPLGPLAIDGILSALDKLDFDRLYGAFRAHTVKSDAKQAIEKSAERFLRAITLG